MTVRINCFGLQVADSLYRFIEDKVLPGLQIKSADFWKGFAAIVKDLTPINDALLAKRDRIQRDLDKWHQTHPGPIKDMPAYRQYLKEIGYIDEIPANVVASTQNVDDELALQAGPQLVVPVLNARYALNAANARWGSLYDALYGTDVLSEEDGATKGGAFNPIRGAKVVAYARQFLDQAAPLLKASYSDVVAYTVVANKLAVKLKDGSTTGLLDEKQFVGYQGDPAAPSSVLLRNNGIHIDIEIDKTKTIGASDLAGVNDVVLEAALSTILDLEDSVAVVDADDKVLAYENWLGILKGTLVEEVSKGGKTFTRRLNPDRQYKAGIGAVNAKDGLVTLHGRSLLFLRNVGHLMTNPAIITSEGKEVYEGILDAVVTVLIALYDINRPAAQAIGNTRKGSVYIVKPKMHSPEEVAFASELFSRVEKLLGLPENTVKLGIMDEERRMSVNIKAAIAAAGARVAFINTGFLDRTGDEIHTGMYGGAMVRKGKMKVGKWFNAYERRNVLAGLDCGLRGRAQIGKGMWPAPDLMREMVEQKIAHPQAGANTAWVPSPTAATLHAMHYHQVNVAKIQEDMEKKDTAAEYESLMDDLLTVPIALYPDWTKEEIREALNNNCQGILGYVVRWIDQGVGCSKVPDIYNVGLMEDRATLRISSQHIVNWLLHKIVTVNEVNEALQRMASIVDMQNAGDPLYKPMMPNYKDSFAFQAASDLIFKGLEQPNGYTEPLLHAWRRQVKGV
ncbi:malate synthase G [Polynucleobacter sp. IMCC 30228]|uniref:malate synthase G n=1 Tax=Polynucleobacter sp. IMCC 30228 TaxID=2781011 RepID=UPI001F3E57C8|nr:malate synthase G [Polynucleobacter sp. IMCC 30228]MCE7527158.1 malate synthase G [Polynucleobacter sp. IMCC 30228]